METRGMIDQEGVSNSGGRRLTWAIISVLIVFFSAALSMNIVLTAMPVIIGDLGGNQIQYSWVIIVNLLANAASTPIWGKLADMVSKKLLIQCVAGIFIAACVIAGAAQNIEVLLFGRFFQGVAMGGAWTLTMAIIAVLVTPRQRGRYSGYIGLCLTASVAAGPLLGGLIADTLGWRWCFFAGVPLCAGAMVLLHRTMSLHGDSQRVRVDYLGSLLLLILTSAAMIWLSFAGGESYFAWFSWESGLALLGMAALLLIFIWVEHRSAFPVVSIRLLFSRTAALASVAVAATAVCLVGLPPYLMQYYQLGQGLSPTAAGLMMLPLIAGNLLSSTVTGRLIVRTGAWKIHLIWGSSLLSASLFVLAGVAPMANLWQSGVLLFVAGTGFGALMQNMYVVVQNSVTIGQVGQASALVGYFRTFGGAASNAVLGSVMAAQIGPAAMVEPVAGTGLPEYTQAAGVAFLVAACMTCPAILAVLLIKEVPLRKTL